MRINASGCLDRCELGPTMVVYPDAVWYRYRTRADVDEILDSHVVRGRPVERLMLRPSDGPFRDRRRPTKSDADRETRSSRRQQRAAGPASRSFGFPDRALRMRSPV